VVEAVAVKYGVCVHPIPVRRLDPETGATDIVDVPCGATVSSKCPSCAERARLLRITQCRQGWHLDVEPMLEPDDPSDEQLELATLRADLEAVRAEAVAEGLDLSESDAAIARVDEALTEAGVRGNSVPSRGPRRVRSTRRRQDAPDLPPVRIAPTTIGRTFAGRAGKVFRPSVFVTVTCRSYGRVDEHGVPRDLDRYDYVAAARDAIHFPKAVDRLWQNLRRVAGFEVQYFAVLEPQRRLAPHLHAALRGTISRADLRLVAAATHHQVWWPSTDTIVYGGVVLPVWDELRGGYLDPGTGEPLPMGRGDGPPRCGPDAQPSHVVRFWPQLHAQGVLSGSPDADRCIGYLVKYLAKSIDTCHDIQTPAQEEHLSRLWRALRFEPCSPTCANWLRYGIQPKSPRAGLRPGCCRGKTHRRETLGFGGRRVLVSRKWSGKTLADHRADRRDWVRNLLGLPDDPASNRYLWIPASASDPDVLPRENRLVLAIADRARWRDELDKAQDAARRDSDQAVSATAPSGHPGEAA
jgi:hypothetical protein